MCAQLPLLLPKGKTLTSLRCSYEDYNKPDLIIALDNHLFANRSAFAGDDRLADYYRRLAQPARFATPAKRAMRVEVPSSSPAEVTRSTRRQRAVQPQPVVKKEEKESGSEQEQDQEQDQEETKSPRSVAVTYAHILSMGLVRWY